MTRLELLWRTYHIKQENIWAVLILELLQANMNIVADSAEKKDVDAQSIIDIANMGIDAMQIYLLLSSLYSKVGVYWGVRSKSVANATQSLRDSAKMAQMRSSIDRWSIDKAKKAADDIIRTQKRQVKRIVDDGIASGLTKQQLVYKVRTNKYMPSHAMLISRVNVVTAANRGTLEAANQSEYQQMKTWNNVGDARVRDPSGPITFSKYTHVDVDGVTIPIDHPFLATHGYIQYPGDPEAAFENIVQCRCFMSISTVVDANGKPVPKKMPGISIIMPSNTIPGATTSEGGVTVTAPSPDITVIRPGTIPNRETITF